MTHDMIGTPVSEAEAAAGLGFADVSEFRRWQTEIGQKVADLEQRLRVVTDEKDRFLWHVRRMRVVLEKAEPLIDDPDVSLAIGVVLGTKVDWDYRLKGWFKS